MSHSKRVRGVSVYRSILIGNVATIIPLNQRQPSSDHTHSWTIAIRSVTSSSSSNSNQLHPQSHNQIGNQDDLSSFIKKVTFKLHETYPTPLRVIEKSPFEVTETGWGEFDIMIKIFFIPESGEKPLTFSHHLKLHPWPVEVPPTAISLIQPTALAVGGGGTSGETMLVDSDPLPTATPPPPPPLLLSPVHSWQYEELIFTEPTETFYSILLSKPPTPLPKSIRMPKQSQYVLNGSGNIGEFTSDLEKEEGERIEEARRKTLEEIDKMRKRLIDNEKELSVLRAEVEEINAAASVAPSVS